MNSPSSLGIIFIAIAVVFLGISFRDYLKTEGKLTIARKIWLRMAFIFAGVGIGLYLVHTFLR
jgi:polyferredoxin